MNTSAVTPTDARSGTASPIGELPATFRGAWEGTGIQVDPAMDYPVLVILTGGQLGDTVGFIDYPSFPCGGPVVLVEVTDEYVDLAEQMEFGTEHCISGAVRLELRPAARLDYRWHLPDGTAAVSATLSRRPMR